MIERWFRQWHIHQACAAYARDEISLKVFEDSFQSRECSVCSFHHYEVGRGLKKLDDYPPHDRCREVVVSQEKR